MVDLNLANVTVGTNLLWAGDPVTISWSGFNASTKPILGGWTDGVYLSVDDRWDISDILLALWRRVPLSSGDVVGDADVAARFIAHTNLN